MTRFTRTLQWPLCVVACAVLAVLAWANYSASRRALEAQIDAEAVAQVKAIARGLDDFVDKIGMLPRTIASRQRAVGPRPDPGVVAYLVELLREVPAEEVYGVYLAFDGMRWNEPNAMPWVDRKGFPRPTQVEYDYHDAKWEWYNAPKQTRRFNVTEPYYDDGGSNITMVSLNAPILAEDGRYIGTSGADLSLDRLMAILNKLRPRPAEGHAYLVSRGGKIIAHPDSRLMLRKDYPGEDVKNLEDGRLVAAQPGGSGHLPMNGEMRRVYWWQAPSTGWKVVLNAPEAAMLGPVNALAVRAAVVAALAMIVMVLAVVFAFRRTTEPSRG
jgi:hypothetical protein